MEDNMTHRERVKAILHYQGYDKMPVVHFGYWTETLEKWANEGHISMDLAKAWTDDCKGMAFQEFLCQFRIRPLLRVSLQDRLRKQSLRISELVQKYHTDMEIGSVFQCRDQVAQISSCHSLSPNYTHFFK